MGAVGVGSGEIEVPATISLVKQVLYLTENFRAVGPIKPPTKLCRPQEGVDQTCF